MFWVFLKYVAIVTISLSIPIEIGCCSMNTYQIISLMSQNPDFRNDPCYIEWKAGEDAKLVKIWTDREILEKHIADNNRKRMEYEAQERENRRRSYSSTSTVQIKKETGFWKVLGAIGGIMVGICCCAACVSALQKENDEPTTNIAINIPQRENPTTQLTSVVASDSLGNQTTLYTSTSNSATRQESDANLPLMPRRQDSLPSYEDAVRMPSAPPT